jgi:hypothetical protein
MRKGNRHRGSSFDDFLREQTHFDAVQAAAVKRALAEADWAVWVDRNWRPTFAFTGVDAVAVDCRDYH